MPRPDQPTISTAQRLLSVPQDSAGGRWKDAALDPEGRVLAGHREDGTFVTYVPTERLYGHLMDVVAGGPTER